MYVNYAIDLLKQEKNMEYVVGGFIINVKKPQRKEQLKNAYTTSVIKDKEQKQLEVAIRELRKQLQQEEESRTEVETKYKNSQNIHESTKKEKKIYQTGILKLKHEKDTAEEVMKALRNTNFNKIQISSATNKEQQIQKLNSKLEKEQGIKKIMAKENIELKTRKPRKI